MAMRGARVLIAVAAVVGLAVSGCAGGPDGFSINGASATVPSTAYPSTSTSAPPPPVSTTPQSSTVRSTPRTTAKTTKPAAPTPTTDPLTGGTLSANPVIAAKIDNTTAGFPQFGINDADIIYVEQVEGGLTRLVMVFHSVLPTEVGAARSMRSTDVELLPTYGTPILVASGGAGGPMSMLAGSRIIDATQQSGGPGYWRSQYGDGTHNLHVDLTKVAQAYPQAGKVQSIGLDFATKDPRLTVAKKVGIIDVVMQSGDASFTYQGAGEYQVFHHGTAYQDQNGKDVYAQNVLVQHVTDAPDGTVDVIGSPSYLSHTVGTGTFSLFRNGREVDGTWSRASVDDPTSFLDAKGKPFDLLPGKTWILLAPQTSSVSTN